MDIGDICLEGEAGGVVGGAFGRGGGGHTQDGSGDLGGSGGVTGHPTFMLVGDED